MLRMYHGTSYENFKSMLAGKTAKKQNWVNSDPDSVYFYCSGGNSIPRSIKDSENAYDSALLCAAIQKSQYDRVIIINMVFSEEDVITDISDDFGSGRHDRLVVPQELFMDKIINGDYHHIEGYYEPEKRWMYLYNLYHNTCGLDGKAADPFIVDKEDVYKLCDQWYEKQPKEDHAYEHHFEGTNDGFMYGLCNKPVCFKDWKELLYGSKC